MCSHHLEDGAVGSTGGEAVGSCTRPGEGQESDSTCRVFCVSEPAGSYEQHDPGCCRSDLAFRYFGGGQRSQTCLPPEREHLTHTMRTQLGGQLFRTLSFQNLYQVYGKGGQRWSDHLSFCWWVEQPWKVLVTHLISLFTDCLSTTISPSPNQKNTFLPA